MHERRNAKRGAARFGVVLVPALALGAVGACDRERGEPSRADGGKGGRTAGQGGTSAGGKADGGEAGTPAEAGAGGVAGTTGQRCPPGATGERVICAEGIVVTFPAGVLPDGATVTVSRTNEKDFQDAISDLLLDMAVLPLVRMPGEIRINTGSVRLAAMPPVNVRVRVALRLESAENVPSEYFAVLALAEQGGDNNESLLSLEPFPTTFHPETSTIEATVPSYKFLRSRYTRSGNEAILIVVRAPDCDGTPQACH